MYNIDITHCPNDCFSFPNITETHDHIQVSLQGTKWRAVKEERRSREPEQISDAFALWAFGSFCCVLSDHCFCPLIPSPLAKWNLPNPSSGADEKKQDDKVDQDC